MRKMSVLFASVVCCAPATAQQTTGTEPVEAIEVVEDVEAVDQVAEVADVTPQAAPGATEAGLSGLDLLGRLHPALVHLPIGFLLLVLALDLLAFVLGKQSLAPCGLVGLSLFVVACVPAIVTGLLRADALPSDPTGLALTEIHRNLNFISTAVAAVALALRVLRRDDFTGMVRWAYLALLCASMVLIGAAGHYGGKLVFGENFLPF